MKICEHGSLKRQCYTCELEEEVDRLTKAIELVMDNTWDDDAHEFLNRVLDYKENEGPDYRWKLK